MRPTRRTAARAWLRTAIALLAAIAVAASSAAGQAPAAVRVAADNDAFAFWRMPWDRTDRDYTSGVVGVLEFEGRSPVFRGVGRLARLCGACASTHAVALGQAIYTGDFSRGMTSGAAARRFTRPNAGWLYVEAAQRDSNAANVYDVRVAVGVVGPPALAEPMQRFFHQLGPEFQRPVDWTRQLPFEPAFVMRLARRVTWREFGSDVGWRGSLTTHLGGALGTILTGVSTGGGGAASVQLGGRGAGPRWPRLTVTGEVTAHGVARDEFLDGTAFRSSDRASRIPFYDEERLALALRWARLGATYRVTRAGLQYRGQHGPSAWGTLEAEWRPAR